MNSGQLLNYPQAVVKQYLSHQKESVADMWIQLNSDIDWYLVNSHSPIKENQYDFNCILNLTIVIAAHELAHGLGFKSGLVSHAKDIGQVMLAPRILKPKNTAYFAPLSAFDSLLHLDNDPLVHVADDIVTFGRMANKNEVTYFEAAIAWPNIETICTDLYLMVNIGNLALATPTGNLYLKRPKFMSDTEVWFYVRDSPKEFVVEEDINFKGKTLEGEILKREMNNGIFGPLTIQVFQLIGYPVAEGMPDPIFEISPTFGSSEYDPMDAKCPITQSIEKSAFQVPTLDNPLFNMHASSPPYGHVHSEVSRSTLHSPNSIQPPQFLLNTPPTNNQGNQQSNNFEYDDLLGNLDMVQPFPIVPELFRPFDGPVADIAENYEPYGEYSYAQPRNPPTIDLNKNSNRNIHTRESSWQKVPLNEGWQMMESPVAKSRKKRKRPKNDEARPF